MYAESFLDVRTIYLNDDEVVKGSKRLDVALVRTQVGSQEEGLDEDATTCLFRQVPFQLTFDGMVKIRMKIRE